MPDFVDPPELQNAPICSGSLRPKTSVQKHAHRYCVKSSRPPIECSSQPARSDYSNLPKPLETLGIAALRGNPQWNAKPESLNRARQPQSSGALAPNDANHAIVERLKSPRNALCRVRGYCNRRRAQTVLPKRATCRISIALAPCAMNSHTRLARLPTQRARKTRSQYPSANRTGTRRHSWNKSDIKRTSTISNKAMPSSHSILGRMTNRAKMTIPLALKN